MGVRIDQTTKRTPQRARTINDLRSIIQADRHSRSKSGSASAERGQGRTRPTDGNGQGDGSSASCPGRRRVAGWPRSRSGSRLARNGTRNPSGRRGMSTLATGNTDKRARATGESVATDSCVIRAPCAQTAAPERCQIVLFDGLEGLAGNRRARHQNHFGRLRQVSLMQPKRLPQ